MSKPIAWWEPRPGGTERAQLERAVASGYLNEGPLVAEFETAVARAWGAQHAIATTSGTAALYLAMRAAQCAEPHRTFVLPSFTFIATANAAAAVDRSRVWIEDVDPTLRLRAFGLGAAVVPVLVSGVGLPPGRLWGSNTIVLDAAEAVPPLAPGYDMACLSFSPHKVISTGQGGAVLTDDAARASLLRSLRNQGRTAPTRANNEVFAYTGFNLRMTDLQAAVGLAQLEVLPSRVARLARNADLYDAHFASAARIQTQRHLAKWWGTPLWTAIICESEELRDDIERRLTADEIGTRRPWIPLHLQPCYAEDPKRFPNTEQLYRRFLWLPSGYTLRDEDIERVCEVVKSCL